MTANLRIEVSDPPSDTVVHRFRNFAEDVYRDIREICTASIEDIDRANTSFTLSDVRTRNVATIKKAVLGLARRHGFESTITIREL